MRLFRRLISPDTIARFLRLLFLGGTISCAIAADIFVAPNGDDRNVGNKENPIKTLPFAQKQARAFAGKEPVSVHLAPGIYYLNLS